MELRKVYDEMNIRMDEMERKIAAGGVDPEIEEEIDALTARVNGMQYDVTKLSLRGDLVNNIAQTSQQNENIPYAEANGYYGANLPWQILALTPGSGWLARIDEAVSWLDIFLPVKNMCVNGFILDAVPSGDGDSYGFSYQCYDNIGDPIGSPIDVDFVLTTGETKTIVVAFPDGLRDKIDISKIRLSTRSPLAPSVSKSCKLCYMRLIGNYLLYNES